MWPYFTIVFFILILQIRFTENSTRNFNYNLAFLLLFCFAALRGNGDGDYFAYLRYSSYITSVDKVLDPNFPMEIGFRTIAYIVNKMGVHPQAVIAIMNLISLTSIYKFIKRYSPDKMLSILLFLPLYFQFDMHAARTAVAISISTYSFKYIYEKKPLKFLLVIILASCFHKTALILIVMYFIGNMKVNKFIGVISMLMVAVLTTFISFSNIIFKMLKFLRLNSIANRYSTYIYSVDYGYPFKLYDPRLLLVAGMYILAKAVLDSSDRIQNLLINYIWINALLMIIFREHTVFVTRLTSYFNIYTIILVPYIIMQYRNSSNISIYALSKISSIYIYLAYIIALLIGKVEYKLFFI